MKRALAVVAIAVALVSVPAPAVAAAAPELRTVPLPFLWSRAALYDVTADGAGGVWVGGVQGRYCLRWADFCVLESAGNPVVRRRVGSTWKEYPLNGWTGQGDVSEISSHAGETWISGGKFSSGGSSTYVARFDGSAFQKVAIPTDSVGMVATSAAGTFITYWDDAPKQRLLKRTGNGWTEVAGPGFENVQDIQGLTATDVWAVGDRDGLERGSVPAAAHFDGTSWKSVPLPADTGSGWFLKVVPVAANDVWAITQKHLMHWNGSAWSLIKPPAELAEFADLTVDASGTPWVAPSLSPSLKGPYRYSGGRWEAATVPAGVGVRNVAAVPGGVWGVGFQGDDGPAAVSGS